MSNEFVIPILEWVIDYYIPLGAGMSLLIVVWLSYLIFPAGRRKKMRRRITRETYLLSERQRKQRMHALLSDGIAEVLLDLYEKGEMNQPQYENWHLKFGALLNLPDLLPRKLTILELKKAIKSRVRSGFYKPNPFFKTEPVRSVPVGGNKLDAILAKHSKQ